MNIKWSKILTLLMISMFISGLLGNFITFTHSEENKTDKPKAEVVSIKTPENNLQTLFFRIYPAYYFERKKYIISYEESIDSDNTLLNNANVKDKTITLVKQINIEKDDKIGKIQDILSVKDLFTINFYLVNDNITELIPVPENGWIRNIRIDLDSTELVGETASDTNSTSNFQLKHITLVLNSAPDKYDSVTLIFNKDLNKYFQLPDDFKISKDVKDFGDISEYLPIGYYYRRDFSIDINEAKKDIIKHSLLINGPLNKDNPNKYFSFSSDGSFKLKKVKDDKDSLSLGFAIGGKKIAKQDDSEFFRFLGGIFTEARVQSENTSDFTVGALGTGISFVAFPGTNCKNPIHDAPVYVPPKMRVFAEYVHETKDSKNVLTGADFRYGTDFDWRLFFTEDLFLDLNYKYVFYPEEPLVGDSRNSFSYFSSTLKYKVYDKLYVYLGYSDGCLAPLYEKDDGLKTGFYIDFDVPGS